MAVAFNEMLEINILRLPMRLLQKARGYLGASGRYQVNLFKSVPPKAIEIIHKCCEYENEYRAEHGVDLYPGMEQTIKELHKKYKLFIVSNCQEGYIQCLFKIHPHLEEYFTDYEYPGRSGKPKADNIKMVVKRNNLLRPIYIGDTAGDAKASKEAGVPFIYARYGFGQVDEFDYVIDSPGAIEY